MRFNILTLLTVALAPLVVSCSYCSPRNPDGFKASDELKSWFKGAADEFFPFRDGWEKGYKKHFSKDLTATFNATWYDYHGLKDFYKNRANPILQDAFKGTFQYGFTGLVAVPFLGITRGGWVYATVWEFGYRWGNPDLPWNVTLGAFGLIEEEDDCKLRIREWREASNLGYI